MRVRATIRKTLIEQEIEVLACMRHTLFDWSLLVQSRRMSDCFRRRSCSSSHCFLTIYVQLIRLLATSGCHSRRYAMTLLLAEHSMSINNPAAR